MPELVCPRCRPGTTKLSQVISCIAQKQTGLVNPNRPNEKLDMPAANTDKMRFPYFGKGRSRNLIGAGFVVGFKEDTSTLAGSNGRGNRWRLDYDVDKGLHVNFESDELPKMAHRFGIIDAQPFVAKICNFPTGMANLTDEEKVKRMWYSWTKQYIDNARKVSEVLNEMANAYKDIKVNGKTLDTADQFFDEIKKAANYNAIAFLLKPTA